MRIEYFGGTHGAQIAKRNDRIGHPLWCAFRFRLQPMAFPDRIRNIGTDLNVHRLCDRQIADIVQKIVDQIVTLNRRWIAEKPRNATRQ